MSRKRHYKNKHQRPGPGFLTLQGVVSGRGCSYTNYWPLKSYGTPSNAYWLSRGAGRASEPRQSLATRLPEMVFSESKAHIGYDGTL